MLSRRRGRSLRLGSAGMTIVEILVVLAVVALIAGVTAPQIIGRLRQGQTATLASNLKNLSAAILAFRGDVGRYPRRLSYLGSPIVPGATDSCNQTIPDTSSWKGPYLAQTIPTSGLPLQGMLIVNQTTRTPTSGGVGTLLVTVNNVDQAVANELEASFDGTPASSTGGTIRWSAGSGGQVTLRYAIPIRGC